MKVLGVILGCLLIVAGIYCIAAPEVTFSALGWLFGLSMLVDGVSGIFAYVGRRSMGVPSAWTLIGAIISILLGLFVLGSTVMQFVLDSLFAYLVAFWLAFDGVCRIATAFDMRALYRSGDELGKSWGLTLAMGILVLVFGILCIAHPLIAAVAIGLLMGCGIIAAGFGCVSIAVNS